MEQWTRIMLKATLTIAFRPLRNIVRSLQSTRDKHPPTVNSKVNNYMDNYRSRRRQEISDKISRMRGFRETRDEINQGIGEANNYEIGLRTWIVTFTFTAQNFLARFWRDDDTHVYIGVWLPNRNIHTAVKHSPWIRRICRLSKIKSHRVMSI